MSLIRGESMTVQKEVSASGWQDKKVVVVMSTKCQPSDGGSVPVPCPQSVILRNKYMGGVDGGDQLRGYYECRKMSRKFYIPLPL